MMKKREAVLFLKKKNQKDFCLLWAMAKSGAKSSWPGLTGPSTPYLFPFSR
jgi:hypothetical protein